MKNLLKSIIISIVVAIFGGSMLVAPAFAACSKDQLAEGCVSTAILGDGCSCDGGQGESINNILQLVVNILSVGIGVLAVIGIVVVGIQYLTAGGNEEQTRKAKRRLLEIVIGVAAYILIYAILRWLLPGFSG